MTTGAPCVAGRQRALVDVELAGARCVAGRAALIRRVLRLVHAMTVEAAVESGVLRLLGRVTARAGPGIERRRAVRVVAITARLIGVRTDGVATVLGAIVARHARRRGAGREAVAVLTGWRVDARMQWGLLGGVAALADVLRWRCEPGVAVARLAGNLADVRDVADARRDLAIGHRYLLGDAILMRRAAPDCEHGQHEHAHHGRDPIG